MSYITPGHVRAFQMVRSQLYDNITLASCLVNGEPGVAIVMVDDAGEGKLAVMPLFVAITPKMELAFPVKATPKAAAEARRTHAKNSRPTRRRPNRRPANRAQPRRPRRRGLFINRYVSHRGGTWSTDCRFLQLKCCVDERKRYIPHAAIRNPLRFDRRHRKNLLARDDQSIFVQNVMFARAVFAGGDFHHWLCADRIKSLRPFRPAA